MQLYGYKHHSRGGTFDGRTQRVLSFGRILGVYHGKNSPFMHGTVPLRVRNWIHSMGHPTNQHLNRVVPDVPPTITTTPSHQAPQDLRSVALAPFTLHVLPLLDEDPNRCCKTVLNEHKVTLSCVYHL